MVLATGGLLAGREWARRTSPAVTGALVATYLGAFGLSHPLAKRIGAWPAVLTVSAITAAASCAGGQIASPQFVPRRRRGSLSAHRAPCRH